MLARIRGLIVLAAGAVMMVMIFFGSLPWMILSRSGDLPIWLGRRVWGPVGLWLAGARLEVRRAAAPPDGPVIFAANHESALDIWVAFTILQRSFRFIAKQELFRLPVFGWYMRLGGHIPVDRSNHQRAIASLRRAGDTVRAGTSVVVFPEGTRSRDGHIQPFKKGPFVVAMQAGVPVVPIAISGSGVVTPSRKIAVYPGPIRVAVGEAVYPASFPDKESLLAEVHRRIVELHRSIGGLGDGAPPTAAGAPGIRPAADPVHP